MDRITHPNEIKKEDYMKKYAWIIIIGIMALLLTACNEDGHDSDDEFSGADPQYVDAMGELFLSWATDQWFPPAGGDPAEDNAVREVCEEIRTSVEYRHSPERIQSSDETAMKGMTGGEEDMAALAYITLMEEGAQRKDLYLVASLAPDKDIHVCLVVNGKAYFTDPYKMKDKLILGQWHDAEIEVVNDGTRLNAYEWGGVR
jgi:hypothetical protein